MTVGDGFEAFYEATHGRIAAALLASLRREVPFVV